MSGRLKNVSQNLAIAFKVMTVVTIIMIVIGLLMGNKMSWEYILTTLMYNFYFGIPLSVVNGVFFDGLTKIYPWVDSPTKRTWLGVIGSIVLTMATLFLLNYILWVWIWGSEVEALFSERNRIFYLVAFVVTIIIASVVHAISFYKLVMKEKLINEQLRKEKLTTELNILKAHVDPHFLFNSFNTLSALIDEDKTKAQGFLKRMSSIYRHVLENRDEDTSTVSDELAFAKEYLSLQQTRFENSIDLNIDISEPTTILRLPALSLQLLFENAIKHNAFNEEHPLKVEVYEEKGYLVIKNNRSARRNLQDGSGMGLQNIQDRYALLSEKEVLIEDLKDSFIVKLPLL